MIKSAIGPLLVTISLVVGVLSATTAYLVPVERIDLARGDRVILYAPAGTIADRDDPRATPQPVLEPGPPDAPLVIGEAELATLREAGVERVHSTRFKVRHWQEAWWFALACAGLIGGAMLIRQNRRQQLSAASRDDDNQPQMPPEQLLEMAVERARSLRDEGAAMTDSAERLRHWMRGIEAIQAEFLLPVEAARPIIIHRHGMAGYARLMDRFATAERRLHRAWSASADNVPAEAAECLDQGILVLQEARDRLG